MTIHRNSLILFLSFTLISLTNLYSSNLPVEKLDYNVLVYEFKGLTFIVDRDSGTKIDNCLYSEKHNDFHVRCKREILSIQVVDSENKLVYNIPVESKDLHINIKDFSIGEYTLNFQFDLDQAISKTTLVKKY